jgi:hypothetical protein
VSLSPFSNFSSWHFSKLFIDVLFRTLVVFGDKQRYIGEAAVSQVTFQISSFFSL